MMSPKMFKSSFRFFTLALCLLLVSGLASAAAQEAAAPPHSEQKVVAEKDAAGTEKGEAVDSHAAFKESPSVQWIAKNLNISTKAAYWVSTIINFVIVLLGIFLLVKKVVAPAFAERRAAIQRGIEDARKASADSAERLKDVEARLSTLDQQIAEMRTSAEKDAATQEAKLREATEAEKKKIMENAEQEIAAASNNARRDLRLYAAELAVSLAEKKINVSADADKLLVKDFASSLTDARKGGN